MLVEKILEVLASGALSAALVAFLLLLARTWLLESLTTSVRHRYEVDLAKIRNELDQATQAKIEEMRQANSRALAIQAAAVSLQTSTSIEAHGRSLQGIQLLWADMVRLRGLSPTFLGILDMIPDQGLGEVSRTPAFMELLLKDDPKTALESIFKAECEEVRPFVGEYLFALFAAYRNVITFAGAALYRGALERDFKPWFGEIKPLLAQALTPGELSVIESARLFRIGLIKQNLETKFLTTASQILSGEMAVSGSFDQARKIVAETNKLQEVLEGAKAIDLTSK
jgi:hypothetical protein